MALVSLCQRSLTLPGWPWVRPGHIHRWLSLTTLVTPWGQRASPPTSPGSPAHVSELCPLPRRTLTLSPCLHPAPWRTVASDCCRGVGQAWAGKAPLSGTFRVRLHGRVTRNVQLKTRQVGTGKMLEGLCRGGLAGKASQRSCPEPRPRGEVPAQVFSLPGAGQMQVPGTAILVASRNLHFQPASHWWNLGPGQRAWSRRFGRRLLSGL